MAEQDLAEFSGGKAEDMPESLWKWLSKEAKANQGGTAFIATHQHADLLSNLVPQKTSKTGHLSWTYHQLLEAVERLSAFFIRSNIAAGDAIYTFLDNDSAAEWTLLFWTAARLGAVLVPMDPRALERTEEVESLSENLKSSVVVVLDDVQARAFDRSKVGAIKLKLMCKDIGGIEGWQSLNQLHLDGDATIPDHHSNLEDVALIMCTSGSTSLPKGCVVTVRGLIAQTTQYHSLYNVQFDNKTRHLVTAAAFRPVCYLSCLNAWAAGGATIFYGSDFDMEKIFATFEEMEITHAWFVPAMVHLLYGHFSKQNTDVATTKTLKVVMTAGDTLDHDLVDAARKMFPHKRTRFIPHWGMSEGAPVFGFVGQDAEVLKFDESTGVAGVGRPLPGTIARVCQPGTTDVAKMGEQGELHVCSVATINRYLGGRAAEDFYEDDKGRWFKTGDAAVMDRTGVVYIVGRTKDIIVVLHMRHIIPSVLEGCLKSGFGVEVVVVGVKDDHHGNVAAAVVKGMTGGEERKKEMDGYVRRKLGVDQGLKGGVWTLEELRMQDWPYNTSKKIQKRDLVGRIEELRGEK